jgi:sodium/potassium-transporting ATPase subunit alpha
MEKESSASVPVALKSIHTIARLCNGAKFDDTTAELPVEERSIKGDPTDTALLRFAEQLAIPAVDIDNAGLLASYEKIFEIPFNSRNKWMLSVIRERRTPKHEQDAVDPETWMLVKGAPDVLYRACSKVMKSDGTVVDLTHIMQGQLSSLQEAWSNEGQRVLALCKKSLSGIKFEPSVMSANAMEEMMYSEVEELTLVGLIGIHDPPRVDVPDAIATIRRAGVRVLMVTGDFKLTAVAIARQVRVHVLRIDLASLTFSWFCRLESLVRRRWRPWTICVLPSRDNDSSTRLAQRLHLRTTTAFGRSCSRAKTLNLSPHRTGMSLSGTTARLCLHARPLNRS